MALAVSLSDFMEKVEEIAAENPRYRKGGSGKDGTCDCIGLIIGAIRRAGGSWPGLHGSNYAARSETENLREIRTAGDLQPGELVYKAYEPGERGYDLPARYRKGGSAYTGDLRDYYHVGVVLSAAPLRILHMTDPGPRTDTGLGQWSWHGECKRIAAPQQASASAQPDGRISVRRADLEKAYDLLGDLLGYRG